MPKLVVPLFNKVTTAYSALARRSWSSSNAGPRIEDVADRLWKTRHGRVAAQDLRVEVGDAVQVHKPGRHKLVAGGDHPVGRGARGVGRHACEQDPLTLVDEPAALDRDMLRAVPGDQPTGVDRNPLRWLRRHSASPLARPSLSGAASPSGADRRICDSPDGIVAGPRLTAEFIPPASRDAGAASLFSLHAGCSNQSGRFA